MSAPIIVLSGTTASRKSDTAHALAKKLGAHILSADSVCIYRGMNIGSAKPDAQMRQEVPYHMIDLVNPDQAYSVMDFQQAGRQVIRAMQEANCPLVIVGGSGLYLNALLNDYQFVKQTLPTQEYEAEQTEHLYARLLVEDPYSAQQIHPHNRQRIIRALAHRAQSGVAKGDWVKQQNPQPIWPFTTYLLTMPREKLHEQIALRVHQMMAKGLLEEVQNLVETYPDAFRLQSMRAIGYREFAPYFQQEASLDAVTQRIIIDTRQFAKRQMTWFRHQFPGKWMDVTQGDPIQQILEEQR